MGEIILRKFKYFIDFEKEEAWLNQMAKQGYQLVYKSFGYEFCLAEPEDTTIKIDYRQFKKEEDFIDYCTLFEDSGWEHIAGNKRSGTQYFKKMHGNVEDDIFSDKLSKAGKYARLSKMFIEMACCFLPILFFTINNNLSEIGNPQKLYLTPGLWDMNGFDFWRAFLFETPFALLRGFTGAFWIVFVLSYFFFAIKAKKLYEKHK
jgi:hypothetical protein